MTEAEVYLWSHIRKKQLGYRFRRQVSIGSYVVDFYCLDLRLAIEIDGPIHTQPHVMEKDQFRQSFIEMDGIVFLRLTNYEVMHQTDKNLERIKNQCAQLKQKSNNRKLLPL